jgi:uncharacterized Ntn-hydrolase superfamily protein
MTWSLIAREVARDRKSRFGIAIASRFFAVGALCIHALRGRGALATQALLNPIYGPEGLALLQAGRSAREVTGLLIGSDEGREQRQLHVIDAKGSTYAYTGEDCVDWCGHAVHKDFSVAGNMLAGPQVLQATSEAYMASAGRPLAERLIAALVAGDAAGGDKRGRQSTAIRVQGQQDYPELDLRVDDHEQPFIELQRLYDKSLERFQPFVACLATRENPAGETDLARIDERIAAFQTSRAARAARARRARRARRATG